MMNVCVLESESPGYFSGSLLLDVFSFYLVLLASDPREKMSFTVRDCRDFSQLSILTSLVSRICADKTHDLEVLH